MATLEELNTRLQSLQSLQSTIDDTPPTIIPDGGVTNITNAVDTAQSAATEATTSKNMAAKSAASAGGQASSAKSARDAALQAEDNAEAAADRATQQATEAINAKTAAVAAQGAAESAQSAAEGYANDAGTAKADALAAQGAAEAAQGKAEDAQEAAETAQGAAEAAQGKAEDAQEAAEDAQEAAEGYVTDANTAKGAAEAAKGAAEAARDAAAQSASAAATSAGSAAATLAGAAQVSANNKFTGNNTFSATSTFNGALVANDSLKYKAEEMSDWLTCSIAARLMEAGINPVSAFAESWSDWVSLNPNWTSLEHLVFYAPLIKGTIPSITYTTSVKSCTYISPASAPNTGNEKLFGKKFNIFTMGTQGRDANQSYKATSCYYYAPLVTQLVDSLNGFAANAGVPANTAELYVYTPELLTIRDRTTADSFRQLGTLKTFSIYAPKLVTSFHFADATSNGGKPQYCSVLQSLIKGIGTPPTIDPVTGQATNPQTITTFTPLDNTDENIAALQTAAAAKNWQFEFVPYPNPS